MHGGESYIALIPARGGSKGIPRKNVTPLAGRPLIEYTIAAAVRARHVDRVVVSTDDEEIARVGREASAEIVRRPAALATDDAPTIDAVLHALSALGGGVDNVVLLQPTSPLRDAELVDAAIELFVQSGQRPLASISPVSEHPRFMRRRGPAGELVPVEQRNSSVRRQDLDDVFRINGAIYIRRAADITSETSFNDSEIGFEMDRVSGVDVDEPADLEAVERLLRRRSASDAQSGEQRP